MKKSMLTTTIIVLMSASAFAIVGSSTTRIMGGPAAVCRMLKRNPDQTLKGICTGTLVAPRKILAAAHCIPQAADQVLTVECGFQGYTQSELSIEKTESGNQVYTKGVHFKESAIARPFFKDLSRDTAIFILDKDMTSSPIRILPEIAFEETAHCQMAGYGRTNDTTAGILYRGVQGKRGYFPGGLASVSSLKAKGVTPADVEDGAKAKKISEKSFITEGMVEVMGRPGDSGGPLLCQLENGETVVAGVFSFTNNQVGLPHPDDIPLNIAPFYQYNAHYKARPTMLKAVEQDVAPQEDAAEELTDDIEFIFPK